MGVAQGGRKWGAQPEKELKTIALIDMAEDSLTTELMPAATAAFWKICELMESSTLRGDNWR
jgi:hypothetical protein